MGEHVSSDGKLTGKLKGTQTEFIVELFLTTTPPEKDYAKDQLAALINAFINYARTMSGVKVEWVYKEKQQTDPGPVTKDRGVNIPFHF